MKYVWIAYTSARSNLAYAGEVLVRNVFMGIILYIFAQLWRAVYAQVQSERLGGLTLREMIWYLVITEAIMISTPRVSIEVDEDVRTGRLAVDLLRPVSYVLYRLGHTLGERLVRFFVNAVAGAAIAILLVGPLHLSASGMGMFMLVLPLAFVLEFLGFFLIGLAAFWLENTSALTLIYSRAGMILGGMLMPVEVFPETWQWIVRALPFASINLRARPDVRGARCAFAARHLDEAGSCSGVLFGRCCLCSNRGPPPVADEWRLIMLITVKIRQYLPLAFAYSRFNLRAA
ncbi:MAG: ABC-2 family transporter protein [Acidobacteria bacterium]|nr:ABC-2 family transporter protein [Acidobacteriota bacterium]